MKIEKKELLQQIAGALRDEFVAEITENAEEIILTFLNGQKFSLTVEEKN